MQAMIVLNLIIVIHASIKKIAFYSHTLENKSSLPPPNPPPPPAGLVGCCCCGGLLVAGVAGAALLHPPKSSSGVTFGGTCDVLPKPLPNADDWVFAGAGVPPHAEKSDDIGIDGALAGAAGFGAGAEVVVVGSGVAHASLDPQASILEKPEEVVDWAGGAGFGAGCDEGAAAERLNGELTVDVGAGANDF